MLPQDGEDKRWHTEFKKDHGKQEKKWDNVALDFLSKENTWDEDIAHQWREILPF